MSSVGVEVGNSTVIDEYLSDLAGELVTTQYVQSAEVDQREEAILRIETDLCRGKNKNIRFFQSSSSIGTLLLHEVYSLIVTPYIKLLRESYHSLLQHWMYLYFVSTSSTACRREWCSKACKGQRYEINSVTVPVFCR